MANVKNITVQIQIKWWFRCIYFPCLIFFCNMCRCINPDIMPDEEKLKAMFKKGTKTEIIKSNA